MQPIQQQGRRIPSLSSVHTRSTCSRRVSGFLTEITQHIHSLRASGVRFSHIVRALGSEVRASRKSAGRSCTTPPEIFLVIGVASYILWFIYCLVGRRSCACPKEAVPRPVLTDASPRTETKRSEVIKGTGLINDYTADWVWETLAGRETRAPKEQAIAQ